MLLFRPGQGFTKVSDPKARSKDGPPQIQWANNIGTYMVFYVGVNILIYCELQSTEFQNLFFLMGQSIKEAHCKKIF
jgi:hypothetical protein